MTNAERQDRDEFMRRARDLFALDVEQESDIREAARVDLDFRTGDQWDPRLKAARHLEDRPALTFDKTHVYIQSVANEARQNKPQGKVNPIGGGASTDTATVINGILRHISYRSQADRAWDTALDYSCGSSFGYVRAITEYAPQSFDQEVRILPVLDPFTVYGILIPSCRGEKARHMFVVSRMPREKYKRTYGSKEEPVDFASGEWKDAGDWIDDKSIRIAEYWRVETTTKTLRHVLGPDGSTAPIYTDDELYTDTLPFVKDPETGEPMEREEEIDEVSFCKIDGLRVLPGSETEWVGDAIPCVAILGQQIIKDGEIQLFSLIRFIHDTQRLINIYESAIAEKIGLANRVPYLGYVGQFKDAKWEDCNVKNYPYLETSIVKDPVTGQILPLPERQQLEEQIQALSTALQNEILNLKSGMGIYDQSLGEGRSEQSGVGIGKRQQQSNIINFHFSDNLNRAEWDLGAMLLKVIPKIYDRPGRQVRIVGEDQVHAVVVVNQQYKDEETGATKHYPLDKGEYDILYTVGPSYTTARQEAADTLQQFFQAAPETVPLLGDLWVGNLDYPWSREAARRLKAAAPQNIVNPPEDGQAIPPAIVQQMQKLTQDAQQAHAFAQSLHEKLQSKQPEIDSRERMHAADLDFKREQLAVTAAIGEAQAKNVAAIALLNEEVAVIKHERGLASVRAGQESAQEHAKALAASSQQAAADSQQSDQEHQARQQDNAQEAAAQQSQQEAQQQQPEAA
jgi:hypothetical protein